MNSSILSRLEESEPVLFTTGVTSCKSGSNVVLSFGVLAKDQFLFPDNVLISPLCASILNGCASGHLGLVLVEKR